MQGNVCGMKRACEEALREHHKFAHGITTVSKSILVSVQYPEIEPRPSECPAEIKLSERPG